MRALPWASIPIIANIGGRLVLMVEQKFVDVFNVIAILILIASALLVPMTSSAITESNGWLRRAILGCIAALFVTFNFVMALASVAEGQAIVARATKTTIANIDGLEGRLKDLRRQREQLPAFKEARDAGVEAAKKAVDTALELKRTECSLVRGGLGKLCRQREADVVAREGELRKAIDDREFTKKAESLEGEIRAVEEALAKKGVKPDYKVSAGTAAQTEFLGMIMGSLTETKVAKWVVMFIAAMVELISFVGPYVIYREPAPGSQPLPPRPRGTRRQETSEPTSEPVVEASTPAPALAAETAVGVPKETKNTKAVDGAPARKSRHEKTFGDPAAWWSAGVRPAPSTRLRVKSDAYAAYVRWCKGRKETALRFEEFKNLLRKAGLTATPIGNRYFYVDVALIDENEARDSKVPDLKVVASNDRQVALVAAN